MRKVGSDAERATIADLEIYGLSVRTICMLERHLEMLYVDELYSVTEAMVMELPMCGVSTVRELRTAFGNLLANRPVKTVRECVEIQGR